ncbi:unnamed protein product [Clavelina lepadiformis]|uniref:Uncharacterized protein n=1 Tax=Clavelina lepadiformis TaxID=159417 RepID=A0ABP0G625_CLALP
MTEVVAFHNNTDRMNDTRVMRSLNTWSRLSDVPTIPKTKACCGMELKFSKIRSIPKMKSFIPLHTLTIPYFLPKTKTTPRRKAPSSWPHGSCVCVRGDRAAELPTRSTEQEQVSLMPCPSALQLRAITPPGVHKINSLPGTKRSSKNSFKRSRKDADSKLSCVVLRIRLVCGVRTRLRSPNAGLQGHSQVVEELQQHASGRMELDFVSGWCWNKLHFAFSELSRKDVSKLKLVEAVLGLMHVTRFERATSIIRPDVL